MLPGRYTVELDTGSIRLTKDLEVRLDSRIEISEAEVRAQHTAVKRLTEMEKRAIDALESIEPIGKQLDRIAERLGEDDDKAELLAEIKKLWEPLDSIETELVRDTPGLAYRSAAKILEKIRQLRSGGGTTPASKEHWLRPPTSRASGWMRSTRNCAMSRPVSGNSFRRVWPRSTGC